jgi:TP901 family phage tail tape measure protein
VADVNANIGVNIDASNALAQLKSLQRQLAQFHTSVAKSSSAAATAQASLQKNLVNSINATGAFTAELRTVRTTSEAFTNSLEKNKFSMREYFRYAGAATKTFGKTFQSEFDTIGKVAEDRVKKLQTQYIKLGRDTSGAMKAIAVIPNQLDLSNHSTQLQLTAQRQAIFNQLLKQGSTNLLNFGKNTQWAGRQLMVGFTLPLASLGMVASKSFMDMETAAIKFRKVYGDLLTPKAETQQALENIQELAKEFTKYGIAVSTTVGLAAEAAAAGFQGLDLQRQTTEATRLSILGQIDTQQALGTTIALQNAFKMSSEDLADSINFLNAVENQTVVSLDDITIAIPKVAPVIQQLGGDVKDLAFFMTAMKQGGINASEGANALKSGLASLINPTNTASKMLAGMGININNIVESNQGDLKATVIGFAEALDTLDPLNRARAIEQMFGKFQFARLSALFSNVIADGTQASRVLDLAGASIEELSALSESELGMTADSAMNKFKKSVEDLKVALVPVGKAFLEAVTPIIEFVGNLLEKFSGLSDGTKKAITILTIAIGGIGPVALMAFGLLANGLANIIKLFGTLRNGYLRLTGQSQVLGEQTQYMTNEQLEAAAAAHSLNQTHANLTQTFTAESSAVRALIAAYTDATAAASRFAMANPGMMLPGKVRAPKKLAVGGILKGPGTGTSDSIPAMLSNGEAVIPAQNVRKYPSMVAGLISGNIPGYRRGKPGDFAHITGKQSTTIGEALRELEALPEAIKQSRKGLIDKMRDMVDTLGPGVSGYKYSGLGFTQNPSINRAMSGNAEVSAQSFLDDFRSQGTAKWKDSLSYAGQSFDEVADELVVYDKALQSGVEGLLSQNKNAKITSEQFAKLEKEVRASLPQFSKLRQSLDIAERSVTEYRMNVNQSDLQQAGVSSYQVPSKADPTKMSKKARFKTKGGRSERTGGYKEMVLIPGAFDPEQGKFGSGRKLKSAAAVDAQTYTKEFEDKTQDPYMLGRDRKSPHPQAARDGRDDARAYSQASQKELKKRQRRVSQRPQGPAPIGTVAPAGARMLPIVAQPSQSELRRTRRRDQARSIGGRVAGSIGGGRGMAISSGAMIASQFLPGKAGQIAGQASGVAFAAQALMMLPGPLKILGVAALGVAGGMKLLNYVQEKNRQRVEAFGDALKTTTGQAQFLAEKFGFVLKGNALSRFKDTVVKSAPERESLEALKDDPEFKKQFKLTISATKRLSDNQAKIALQFKAAELLSQGMAAESVQQLITAIQEEAGKSNLNIDFKNIKMDEKGLDKLAKQTSLISQESGAKLSKAFEKQIASGQKIDAFYNEEASTKRDIANVREAEAALLANEGYEIAIKKSAAAVASFSNVLSNLAESGSLTGEQLKKSVSTMFASLGKNVKSSGAQMLIFKTALTSVNEELGQSVSGITKLSDAEIILAAATAGVGTEMIKSSILAMEYAAAIEVAIQRRRELGLSGYEDAETARDSNRVLDNAAKLRKALDDETIARLKRIKDANDAYKDSLNGTGDAADGVSSSNKAYVKILQKEIDALKAKRDANKKANDEMQRQIDLQLKQQELTNKMKQEQIKGNYLEAALLGQEQRKNTIEFNQGTADNKLADVIDRLEKRLQEIEDGANLTKAESKKVKEVKKKDIERANGGYISNYMGGGNVSGPGTKTSDSIPAMLSDGEYVIKADSVSKYGVGTFDALNAQRFKDGGMPNLSMPVGSTATADLSVKPTKMSGITDFIMGDLTGLNSFNKIVTGTAGPLDYLSLIPGLGLAGAGTKIGAKATLPIARKLEALKFMKQGIHSSKNPNLLNELASPLNYPPSQFNALGDFTHFSTSAKYQSAAGTRFGDNTFKPKLDVKAIMAILKSKGFASASDMSKYGYQYGLAGARYTDEGIQAAIKDGFIGTKYVTGNPMADQFASFFTGFPKNPLGNMTKRAMGGMVKLPKFHDWNGPVPGSYGQELPAVLKSGTEGIYQEGYINDLKQAASNTTNSSSSVYNVSMNINGADSDPKQIAEEVMKKMQVLTNKNNKMNVGLR